jgi:hypothetical protein
MADGPTCKRCGGPRIMKQQTTRNGLSCANSWYLGCANPNCQATKPIGGDRRRGPRLPVGHPPAPAPAPAPAPKKKHWLDDWI